MAKAVDHISIANANHKTLVVLAGNGVEHLPWMVTVAFYKAVHVVEACFDCREKEHSRSHSDRMSHLQLKPYDQVFTDMKLLFDASKIARYLCDGGKKVQSFSDYLSEDKAKKLLKKRLYSIEQKCITLMKPEVAKALVKFQTDDI